MTNRTVYIDGDVLMYRAAFSAEMSRYGCVQPDGECYVSAVSRKRAQDMIDSHSFLTDCTVDKVPEPLPFSLAEDKLRSDLRDIMRGTGCVNYVIFVTHRERTRNVRYQWATTHPYKGNRKSVAPPIHKDAVYETMVKQGAIVVSGIEADDALGYSIYNRRDAFCASIDKDLLMVPGIHYSISGGGIQHVYDPGELTLETRKYGKKLTGTGFKWFCAQMVLGDPVDNIVGLRGYGDVKTYTVLSSVIDMKSMWNVVKNHYSIAGEDTARLQENASLLWIQRKEGELFEEWMDGNL